MRENFLLAKTDFFHSLSTYYDIVAPLSFALNTNRQEGFDSCVSVSLTPDNEPNNEMKNSVSVQFSACSRFEFTGEGEDDQQ